MRKHFCILLFSLFAASFCFGEMIPSFQQFPNGALVNLESTIYCSHDISDEDYSYKEGVGNGNDSSGYYTNQMLGVLGMFSDSKLNGDIVITAELTSGEWYYKLAGTQYKRPFAIELAGRGDNQPLKNDTTPYNYYLGQTDQGTTNSITITVPKSVASKYNAIWWDAVLVFLGDVNTDDDTVRDEDDSSVILSRLSASDSYYYATVRLSISCMDGDTVIESGTFDVNLCGYYKSPSTESGAGETAIISSMNVEKLSSANAIDIASLFDSQEKTVVANYSYSTNSLEDSNRTGTVSLFLSSTSLGNNNLAEEFTLRHLNAYGQTSSFDSIHNAIHFRAYITSTDTGYSSSNSSSKEVEFDGTGYFASGSALTCDYLKFIEQKSKNVQQTTNLTQWHDSGTISVSIPADQQINGTKVNIDQLIAGQYQSNIYVHILTDFN